MGSIFLKIKERLKNNMPEKLIEWYGYVHARWLNIEYKNKPVSQVFSEIYSKNLWGTSPSSDEFYSGATSDEVYAKPYCDLINNFIKSLGKNKLRVVDLGCGDFRIGEKIAKENNIEYVGVDIVPELIERNKNKYKAENIKFICSDIISEELPDGDICLIRLVLQHLSNNEIMKILKKISKYKYVFITEGQLNNPKSYNEDKPHGPHTRLHNGSGVYLDKPPFNIPNVELAHSVRVRKSSINTFLIKNINFTSSD